jgi:ABC-2 type transport system ATP-binding protein
MLEIKGITKKYNNIPVVNNVDFRVEPGEIVGYLGPNGAGKTTTVRMLAGLLEPTGGFVYLDGEKITGSLAAYKKRIGYVPEQGEFYSHLTGMEYLQLVGRLRHIPAKKLDQKIEGLMEQLGLYTEMHLPLSNYSKGMRQKVLISSALIHDPDILLLDEPLSGLDVSAVLVFKDILTQLAKMGKMVIYSSHILEVVEKVCHRVIIINKGRIVANDSVGNLSNLMELPSLESIFKELVSQEDTGKRASNIISIIKG